MVIKSSCTFVYFILIILSLITMILLNSLFIHLHIPLPQTMQASNLSDTETLKLISDSSCNRLGGQSVVHSCQLCA